MWRTSMLSCCIDAWRHLSGTLCLVATVSVVATSCVCANPDNVRDRRWMLTNAIVPDTTSFMIREEPVIYVFRALLGMEMPLPKPGDAGDESTLSITWESWEDYARGEREFAARMQEHGVSARQAFVALSYSHYRRTMMSAVQITESSSGRNELQPITTNDVAAVNARHGQIRATLDSLDDGHPGRVLTARLVALARGDLERSNRSLSAGFGYAAFQWALDAEVTASSARILCALEEGRRNVEDGATSHGGQGDTFSARTEGKSQSAAGRTK